MNSLVQKHELIRRVMAIRSSVLGAPGKIAAIALIDHTNINSGQCNPSIARLARVMGVSRSSAFLALQALRDIRLVERVRLDDGYDGLRFVDPWEPPSDDEMNAIKARRKRAARGEPADAECSDSRTPACSDSRTPACSDSRTPSVAIPGLQSVAIPGLQSVAIPGPEQLRREQEVREQLDGTGILNPTTSVVGEWDDVSF